MMIKQDYILIIDDRYGAKFYYYKNKPHRLNGPAEIWMNGYQCYYVNHRLHRLDGPAVIFADGDKYYYVHGIQASEEYFYQNYYQEKHD